MSSDKKMQVSRTLLLLLMGLAGLLSTGCTARVYSRGYVQYSPPVVFVEEPQLVYVAPGVYVVRDYDAAVYYSDGYYWSNRGGVWYRTAYWSDPWVSVHVSYVPSTFVHYDHHHYVHYHGGAGAAVYKAPARSYHSASATASASTHRAPAHGSASHHHRPPMMTGNGSDHAHQPVAQHRPSPSSPRTHASAGSSGQITPRATPHSRADRPRASTPTRSRPSSSDDRARAPRPSAQPARASAPPPRAEPARSQPRSSRPAPASRPSRKKADDSSRSSARPGSR